MHKLEFRAVRSATGTARAAVAAAKTQPVRRPRQWGSVATATCGTVTIEIDEGIDQPSWRMTVRTGEVEFSLFLAGVQSPSAAAKFLERTGKAGRYDELRLGTWNARAAVLIRDEEFSDRAFLVIGKPGSHPIRITFAGQVFHHLANALRDVSKFLPG